MTELSPDAKKLFDTAREAFSPDEARLHALHGALQVRLAAPTATATAATKVALLTKTTALIGLGLVTAAVIAVKTFGPQASQNVSAPIATKSSLPARVEQPSDAPTATDTVAGPLAAVATAIKPSERVGRARARVAPRAQITRSELSPTPAAAPETLEMPLAAERETPAPHPAVREQPIAPAVPLADSLADELALLQRAHAALERGDAPAALGVLDQHEERFARGILTQERIATRALALCKAGRTAEARAAARGLLRLAPRSPHLVRLRTSCAFPQTPVD